ncbi:hypothetical protein BGX34_008513, partial [Mortierella sp. NVP85]
MSPGAFKETDREYLDCICPRISKTISEAEENPGQEDDDDGNKSTQQLFIGMLLRFLLSDNNPKDETAVGKSMKGFLDRVQDLGLLARKRTLRSDYPRSLLLESVGRELSREFKKIYVNGSKALQDE